MPEVVPTQELQTGTVFTLLGTVPAAELEFTVHWVDCPDFTVCRPTWTKDGVVVRQDAYVLHRKGLSGEALSGAMGGG